MATATDSITDSTVEDDIPEKPRHPVNYKFPKRTFGQRKAVSHAFRSAWFIASGSGNDFTSWLSMR